MINSRNLIYTNILDLTQLTSYPLMIHYLFEVIYGSVKYFV